MILVPVSDKNTAQLFAVFHDVGKIGYYMVNAQHIGVGEGKTAVYDNHILAVLDNGHVLAYLVQTAERNYLQLFTAAALCGFGFTVRCRLYIGGVLLI